jgi:hypothetical protein
MYASESDISDGRRGYKVGLYFTLSIVMIILIWSMVSELRWILFESGSGSRSDYDTCVLLVIGVTIAAAFSFFTLGQYGQKLSRECKLAGGTVNIEERVIVFFWAAFIGTILGMGFWDIVTMIHLAMIYGILSIWSIPVTVFDFGFWQMIIPVWGLVIIGIAKMGSVLILYALSVKNINRGTICDLAELKRGSVE